MSDSKIIPVIMPKWGLSMKEGKVSGWLVEDGSKINVGEAILEIETDKIAGAVESSEAGVLRRRVGEAGTTYPVKALLGVIAPEDVSDADVDAFIASYVTPPPEADEEEAGPKYEFTEVNGIKLRYAKRGDGSEVAILLHGFGGDLDNWLFNIDAIAEAATVYAIDLPGHGQSSKNIAGPDLDTLVAAVTGFLDNLAIGPAHFIGHSMGGAIGMEIAAAKPSRVKSLTLICSAGLGKEIGSYVDDYVAAASRRDMKQALESLFFDRSLVSRQLVEDVLKYKRLDGVDTFLKGLASELFGGRIQHNRSGAKLAGRLPPTVVIWGKEDRVVPAAHADALAGAKVHVFENAGHMVFMEKSSDVNALIKAQLKSG